MGSLPATFYRVYHDDTFSRYTHAGFIAGKSGTHLNISLLLDLNDRCELGFALQRHLRSNNRKPTPFISVYSSIKAAKRAANGWMKKGKAGVTIMAIDPSELWDWKIQSVRKLADELGYLIPDKIYKYTWSEWIVLDRIPRRAIIKEMDF
jgi:hypothetical protein